MLKEQGNHHSEP